MKYDSEKHHRRSIRLKGYDYSQAGAYFVTICTQNRECLLGEIVNGEMCINKFGAVIQECWDDLPHHYPNVELDAFVIMPNHVHGIIVLCNHGANVGAGLRLAPTPAPTPAPPGLPEIVRAFKSFSSRRINELRGTQGAPLWQRNYYEHIVRNENDFERIRKYIFNNPTNWTTDAENLTRR